jgi:hypothetical protein
MTRLHWFSGRVLGSLFVLGLLPTPNWAQTSTEDRPVGALRSGDWALQFQIVENFALTSFDGLMLSVERHWSPRSALRLGVDLGIETSDRDRRSQAADSLHSSLSTEEGNDNSESVALKMQYVSYSNPEGRLHFYWAAGPSLSYRRGHGELVSKFGDGQSSGTAVETGESHDWGTALAGALGIQWFAARGLGLLAEYGASAGYFFSNENSTRRQQRTGYSAYVSTSENKHHEFRFDSLGVRFGVAVLF